MAHEQSFVHLHLHTEYSMLDGAVRIQPLMQKALEYGMPAVAMTDHGNLFGAIEFYQQAKKAGIKPIIGCETYLAPASMKSKSGGSPRDAATHLTLLAKDLRGYHNLVKLVSAAYLEGFYYKPRIDKELLAQHAEGLICLSGCIKSEINQAIQADRLDAARDSIAFFRNLFGPENFFLEVHDHGLEAQHRCTRELVRFSKEFDLGLVAANDVHFLEKEHHQAHDVMVCIGTGKLLHDEKRLHYPTEVYFKSPVEMQALFAELPEAISNTLAIAERCNLEIEFGKSNYPEYTPPNGKTKRDYLWELCRQGLENRYGERAHSDASLLERLQYEFSVMESAGFISYFLIVWDFINYARQKNIPVGPGRGSAAGSLVAYVLGITDLDPIQFGLIFERFLNPERVSPPDIDIDFCQSRRGEVIDYVRDKYGAKSVAHIVTFGTMGAKSVVRDVGRVMGFSYSDADRLAKMIPNELNMTLANAVEKNPELKQAIEANPETAQLWEYATLLEGLSRNTGIHAAGIVIGDRELDELVPLCTGNEGEVVTQYPMSPLGDLGMLKMDFLGLKTLTVIHETIELIRRDHPNFSDKDIPLSDQPTFNLLNRGETIGVFQLESGGMVSLCKSFDIQSIEDIIALIALYRPGPMDLIPEYIRRKKGQTKIKYEHPKLEEVASETYGILIYQEQVQRAANLLAGYTLGQADILRRAMGKKNVAAMAAERERFIAGCEKVSGIDSKKANAIFDLLEKFAGYGFNKSHSAAYALLSFQTAYLKANYPIEFMCGLLSNEINNTDKIAVFMEESKRMGVKLLPPDINKSDLLFIPEKKKPQQSKNHQAVGNIRFGLAGIKNVGEAAMRAAIAERAEHGEFASLEDFCNRLDTRTVNKKNIESLVKAGAFDFCGRDRAEMVAVLDSMIASAARVHKDRQTGQASLFEALEEEELHQAAPASSVDYQPWSDSEKLAYEKDLLGFYMTGHPLEQYRHVLESGKFEPISRLRELESGQKYTVAGALSEVVRKFTRSEGKPFAIVKLEDLSGATEILVWNEVYEKANPLLEQGKVLSIYGRLSVRDEEVRFSAEEIKNLEGTQERGPVELCFHCGSVNLDELERVKTLLSRSPGDRPVYLTFNKNGGKKLRLKAGPACHVQLTEELKAKLQPWLA